jgi:hypothetical protein
VVVAGSDARDVTGEALTSAVADDKPLAMLGKAEYELRDINTRSSAINTMMQNKKQIAASQKMQEKVPAAESLLIYSRIAECRIVNRPNSEVVWGCSN